MRHDYETIESDAYEHMDDFVRITEYVDAEFKERPAEEVIPESITIYDSLKKAVNEEHAKAVATIDEKIAQLRAITHQPEEPE